MHEITLGAESSEKRSPMVSDVLAKRRREGHLPLIAPKIILQAPLWQDPQYAARHVTMRRRWKNISGDHSAWIVEVLNVLSDDHAEPAASSGLLRYLDLDVTMVLSLQWTLTGSRDIEIDQHDLLQRMGYGRLECAPYDELHASLRRLANSKVAVYREGTPKHLIEPWQIIDESHRTTPRLTGDKSVITARLSRLWEESLASAAWQAVDLNAYSHLVRVARRNGLARVLYLYLASWRDAKGGFDVPLYGIVDRFAQRRSDGRIRYRILADKRCLLSKAITLLQDSQVIQITQAIRGEDLAMARLVGRFCKSNALVPEQSARQLVYLIPSLMPEQGVRSLSLESPTPNLVANDEQRPHQDWATAQNEYCELTLPVLLFQLRPTLPRTRIQKAREGGWEIRNLWTAVGVVLWRWLEEKTIENPAKFLQSVLNGGMNDPAYRGNYSMTSIAWLLPISGSEWMKWVMNHQLFDFPPPRKPTTTAADSSENT